jgi:hypothetical protein
MAKEKKKGFGWTNSQIKDLIRKGSPAEEIRQETGITLATLKNKLIETQIEDDKLYKVEGILKPISKPKVSKIGSILITKSNLQDAFPPGTEFSTSIKGDTISLKKV